MYLEYKSYSEQVIVAIDCVLLIFSVILYITRIRRNWHELTRDDQAYAQWAGAFLHGYEDESLGRWVAK